MRRNIEWSCESYNEDGTILAVAHLRSEPLARIDARLTLVTFPFVAHVDIAEKWETPDSTARAITDIPVTYRYIVRIYRDREEAL